MEIKVVKNGEFEGEDSRYKNVTVPVLVKDKPFTAVIIKRYENGKYFHELRFEGKDILEGMGIEVDYSSIITEYEDRLAKKEAEKKAKVIAARKQAYKDHAFVLTIDSLKAAYGSNLKLELNMTEEEFVTNSYNNLCLNISQGSNKGYIVHNISAKYFELNITDNGKQIKGFKTIPNAINKAITIWKDINYSKNLQMEQEKKEQDRAARVNATFDSRTVKVGYYLPTGYKKSEYRETFKHNKSFITKEEQYHKEGTGVTFVECDGLCYVHELKGGLSEEQLKAIFEIIKNADPVSLR